jgi:thiamine-monophosphate kinase
VSARARRSRTPRTTRLRRPRATRAHRGEFDLIRALTARLPQGTGVLLGPGDDAALLAPRAGRELVATTDAFVIGVHVPATLEPRAIGRRLAAANLSDLAAMAAEPRWALLSLGVSDARDDAWTIDLERGLAEALAEHGAAVVGGNLTRTAGADWMSVALLGDVERGRAWTRYGARPGDLLAVTGHPGRAGAAFRARLLGAREPAVALRPCRDAFVAPASRIGLARALSEAGAVAAAIDLSDGVSGDLAHLCEASGIGATLDAESWPDDPALAAAAERVVARARPGAARRFPPPAMVARTMRELRLGSSDDYELLMAVDPAAAETALRIAAEHRAPLTFIGTCTDAPGVLLVRDRAGVTMPIAASSWDHRARR